jgi:hypothetical protein
MLYYTHSPGEAAGIWAGWGFYQNPAAFLEAGLEKEAIAPQCGHRSRKKPLYSRPVKSAA